MKFSTASLVLFVLPFLACTTSARILDTKKDKPNLQQEMKQNTSSSTRSLSTSCISPMGIDGSDTLSSSSTITTGEVKKLLENLGVPFLFLPMAEPLIQSLVTTYETPIQFRQALSHGTSSYNVAAMYHPTALDIWGDGDMRICIDEFVSEDHKNAHEQVAIAYAFAYSGIVVAPSSSEALTNFMNNVLGLPMSNLDGPQDSSTPWGLAKAYVDQMSEYSKTDGWNADGSLSNGFNKMPFSDFDYEQYSAYEAKETPSSGDDECEKEWSWEPLLETNNAGYFTKQEHVTPFAGFTGRLYGMTSSEYESFSVSKPDYDYCQEADYVLEEARQMAEDEKKKVEIEVFDSKFTSLLPMQINWSLMNKLTSFDFWFYDMVLVTAMYDATMLVWREKVAIDAVRPTTVVHSLKKDSEVESYAGPFQGIKNMNAMDWQPYIRTMPHAEFPSGSSCICTAFAETLQLLTGQDDVGDFPPTIEVKAGASKAEPGVTPTSDTVLTFTSWSEIQQACGESRLYGGMHFSKAIPAGEELCTGVASYVVDRAEKLKMGEASGALADLNDTSITVKRSINKKGISEESPCVDSKSWKVQKKNGNIVLGCSWISGNAAFMKSRCRKIPGALQNCPVACDVCNKSGVEVCNNLSGKEESCDEVGCCSWDGVDKCLSNIGNNVCFYK